MSSLNICFIEKKKKKKSGIHSMKKECDLGSKFGFFFSEQYFTLKEPVPTAAVRRFQLVSCDMFWCKNNIFLQIVSTIITFFATIHTVNPLYTDTQYNDKICYNDNLNVTKHSLKR